MTNFYESHKFLYRQVYIILFRTDLYYPFLNTTTNTVSKNSKEMEEILQKFSWFRYFQVWWQFKQALWVEKGHFYPFLRQG